MTLRGKKAGGDNAKLAISFRCPPDLWRYIEETAKETGREKTEIIIDAIGLDRDLAVKLGAHADQLAAAAATQGLSLDRDLAEVLARLVRTGLLGTPDDKKGKR